MKFFVGLAVVCLTVSNVIALPARHLTEDAEEIDVPRRQQGNDAVDPDFKNFRGVVDTGVGYPFFQPNPNPFSFNFGFFDSFDDIFRRLRTRLWPVTLPGVGDDSSEEGGIPFNIDPKKANTTSEVKIVDGHRVEVNETLYGDKNSVFKVRIVNIRPLESDDDETNTKTNTDVNTDTRTNAENPVTTAPKTNKANDDDDDESDERREPLLKKSNENEIPNGNLDDPEHSASEQVYNIELPATTTTATNIEDNTDNLNAEFVTDNTLEEEHKNGNGNIEAETNKSDNDNDNDNTSENNNDNNSSNNNIKNKMNFYDENALVGQQLLEIAANSSSFTIENNEETEVNDNFNESSVGGIETTATEIATKELTEDLGELNLNADNVHEFNEELQNKNAEDFSSDEVEDAVDTGDSDSDDDNNEFTATSSITKRQQQKHSNYVTKKEREDVSSSDDDEEAIEMSAEFNSEWANLAEDLANVNDRNNDLSNDIDEYAPVPIDLSNDIAVNDIAAAQADYPLNPDAEFIDVNGVLANQTMPKFEKLTIAMTPADYQAATETENMK